MAIARNGAPGAQAVELPVGASQILLVPAVLGQDPGIVDPAAASGAVLWRKQVTNKSPAPGQPIKVNDDTGFAAPTMATDGRLVYAMFATGDLAAFDFSGNEVWAFWLGIPRNNYGHASSLATYKGWVIVQFDQGTAKDDGSKLLALDGATGKTVWQKIRRVPAGWCSPIVVERGSRRPRAGAEAPWA